MFRMPDVKSSNQLELSENEIKKVQVWFDEKRKAGPLKGVCELCGADDWVINPELYTNTVFNLIRDQHYHGQGDLCAKINCDNCGNTKLLEAKKVGFVTKQGLTERTGELSDVKS
jgi:hypothetical protein